MKLVKKIFFGARLILVVLVGILAVPGCGEKKKQSAALWPLALIGSGGSNGSGTGSGSTSAGTNGGSNAATTNGGTGNTSVATPTFSPSAGHFVTPTNITITTATEGATIYYTTDGSEPTISSTQYTTSLGHIWFLAGKTIKAIAVKSGSTNSAVATGFYSYPTLKSGQTTSYAAGDDGATQLGVARSYTNNGDETVTEIATGLLWQRCSVGLSGASCGTGSGTTTDHATALIICSGLSLAGKTWRLPSMIELETLADYGTTTPAINVANFPATMTGQYWSSTSNQTGSAWTQHFNNGHRYNTGTAASLYVRCVSGQPKDAMYGFTNTGGGTVKDNATGLTWQKCGRGQTNDTACSGAVTSSTWSDALAYCSGLSLASKAWRLPRINELKTIVDSTQAISPMIDINVFPATASHPGYWSSTAYAPSVNEAWGMYFSGGTISSIPKTTDFGYARCVSGP